jgi:hypothetical protein
MNESETNEAKRHFRLKNTPISVVLLSTAQFERNFEEKCTDLFPELDNNLQKIARDLKSWTESDGCQQNATVISKVNKIFHPISSDFIHFGDERFQFCFFRKFQTLVQNFDFGLFKFELKISETQHLS